MRKSWPNCCATDRSPRSTYHGENGLRTLKELSRSYLTISKDLTRVMNRLKALYHSWGIPCAGTQVYAPRHRLEWLSKITEVGVRGRAEFTISWVGNLDQTCEPYWTDARNTPAYKWYASSCPSGSSPLG